MVFLFNKPIKNIHSNNILHERVTCDDKSSPWINSKIKQLIQEKNNACRSYILNENKFLEYFIE